MNSKESVKEAPQVRRRDSKQSYYWSEKKLVTEMRKKKKTTKETVVMLTDVGGLAACSGRPELLLPVIVRQSIKTILSLVFLCHQS